MMTFNQLPEAAQQAVKRTLSAYATCTVWEDNATGNYKARAHTIISNNDSGEICLGEYTALEVFTNEQRIINYVEQFKDYPFPLYTGTKDYTALLSYAANPKSYVVSITEGNVVFSDL